MPALHSDTNGSADASTTTSSSHLASSYHSAHHHPNRPVGFAAFVSDVRPRLTRPRTDDNPTTAQLAADLTARWHALTADEKQRYRQTEESNTAVLALADFTAPGSGPIAPSTRTQPSDEPLLGLSLPSLSPSPTSPTHFVFDPLNLSNIRNVLIRLEESIIFALIERAQFKHNRPIYSPSEMPQFNGLSFLSFFLYETEILHSKVRRYTSRRRRIRSVTRPTCRRPFCHSSAGPSPSNRTASTSTARYTTGTAPLSYQPSLSPATTRTTARPPPLISRVCSCCPSVFTTASSWRRVSSGVSPTRSLG